MQLKAINKSKVPIHAYVPDSPIQINGLATKVNFIFFWQWDMIFGQDFVN